MTSQKMIIIGATSGIGAEMARQLSPRAFELGLSGRRTENLKALQAELSTRTWICTMDVADCDAAREQLKQLIEDMDGVDVVVLNAGVSYLNATWEQEQALIDVNVSGFVALANVAIEYFRQKGSGHLVGISSIASIKGFGRAGAYCASKAFISTYMQALRQASHKLRQNIIITDIKPGYVETPMTEKNPGMFWISSVEKASAQIIRAILRKKNHAYITRRWRLAGWLLKFIPDWLYIRLPF